LCSFISNRVDFDTIRNMNKIKTNNNNNINLTEDSQNGFDNVSNYSQDENGH